MKVIKIPLIVYTEKISRNNVIPFPIINLLKQLPSLC